MRPKIRILYIDDYELDRLLVKDALEKEHGGFLLIEAANRQEFEAQLQHGEFDVVLSDFNIAGFEGLDVIEIVRAHDPLIPVIIVTGTGSEEIAVKALKQGASDYVIKRPRHIRKLPQTIFTVLEQKTLEKARIRAKKALAQSESLLRILVKTIPDLVWLKDRDGVYLGCNPMFERFFGAKESEIIGKTDYDFVDTALADFFRDNDRRAMAANKPSKNEEMLTFSDNRYKGLFETIKTPMRDDDGELIGVLGIARDITELRNAENEKIRLERQLKHVQKMEAIGNLAGGIAHDFNNILSSIIGFTELSFDEAEKGSVLEDNLQEVYAAGKRAKALVNQILAFARQSEEEVKPLQPGVIAKEVLKLIRSSIPITIEIKQTIDSDSFVMGNPTQVYQLFMNLFTNAADAMEKSGGLLEFSMRDISIAPAPHPNKPDLKAGDYIHIEVSDNGDGIPPENIQSIFEPYFTTKPPGEGTGMGLAMVHGIIETYGGHISVHSTPGEGTTFNIYLPISIRQSPSPPFGAEELPSGTERILFVDDEVAITKLGKRTLAELGYVVEIRNSSAEALELFKRNPGNFDLVITDMTMPNMTGDLLATEMITIRPDIPVILCTGYSKKMSAEKASETGVKAFIYKPIIKADLAKTIRKVLDEAKAGSYQNQ